MPWTSAAVRPAEDNAEEIIAFSAVRVSAQMEVSSSRLREKDTSPLSVRFSIVVAASGSYKK
jgi:hypothetical protein